MLKLRFYLRKGLEQFRGKRATVPVDNHLIGFIRFIGGLIHPLGSQRIIHIHQRDNLRRNADFIPL